MLTTSVSYSGCVYFACLYYCVKFSTKERSHAVMPLATRGQTRTSHCVKYLYCTPRNQQLPLLDCR